MRYARGNTALLLAVVSVGIQTLVIALGVQGSLAPVAKYQFVCRYDSQLQYKYGVRQGRMFSHYYVDLSDRRNVQHDYGYPLGDSRPYQMPPWSTSLRPLLSEPLPDWLSIDEQPAQETPASRATWECIAAGWPWRSVRAAWHFPQDPQKPRVMEKGWGAGTGYRMAEPGASPDRGFVPSIHSPLALGASLFVLWMAMFAGVEVLWLFVATIRYKNGQCTRCGYAIDELPSAERCPECGCSLNPSWMLRVLRGSPRPRN